MQENETDSIFEETLSPEMKETLFAVSKWTKYISVIGFAIGAFVVILMLFSGAAMFEKIVEMANVPIEGFYGILIAVFFIFFFFAAAILFFLYKGSTLLQQGIQNNDDYLTAEAFVSLKRFFLISAIFSALSLIGNLSSLFNLL